jgi:hypothetical protein
MEDRRKQKTGAVCGYLKQRYCNQESWREELTGTRENFIVLVRL